MYLAAVAAGVLLLWGVVTFNRLIRMRNMVREAWSGIDVQLKRRYDLVTRLEEVVGRYAEHERQLFPEVARLRSRAAEAVGPVQQSAAENALTGGLRSLFAVAEQYPDIKANENFLDLQRNLAEVEDRIQLARRYYNGTVRNMNNLVESFPAMAVARLFGFAPEEFFEIECATQRRAPEVAL